MNGVTSHRNNTNVRTGGSICLVTFDLSGLDGSATTLSSYLRIKFTHHIYVLFLVHKKDPHLVYHPCSEVPPVTVLWEFTTG